jgi:uncharacterized membrane protein
MNMYSPSLCFPIQNFISTSHMSFLDFVKTKVPLFFISVKITFLIEILKGITLVFSKEHKKVREKQIH